MTTSAAPVESTPSGSPPSEGAPNQGTTWPPEIERELEQARQRGWVSVELAEIEAQLFGQLLTRLGRVTGDTLTASAEENLQGLTPQEREAARQECTDYIHRLRQLGVERIQHLVNQAHARTTATKETVTAYTYNYDTKLSVPGKLLLAGVAVLCAVISLIMLSHTGYYLEGGAAGLVVAFTVLIVLMTIGLIPEIEVKDVRIQKDVRIHHVSEQRSHPNATTKE